MSTAHAKFDDTATFSSTSRARSVLICALRDKGLFGVDEEEFVDTLPDLGVDEGEEFAEAHDWQAEVDAARAEGIIEEHGCTWISLSRAWWAAELVRTTPSLTDGQALEIVDMLAGETCS